VGKTGSKLFCSGGDDDSARKPRAKDELRERERESERSGGRTRCRYQIKSDSKVAWLNVI
jgi:hypothetical protein